MAIMMGKLYAALRKADVPDDDAIAAAEEAAAFQNQLSVFDNRLATFDNRLTKIEGDVALLKWMVGFSLAMNIAIIGLVLRLLSMAR
jgi:hypothetical protein